MLSSSMPSSGRHKLAAASFHLLVATGMLVRSKSISLLGLYMCDVLVLCCIKLHEEIVRFQLEDEQIPVHQMGPVHSATDEYICVVLAALAFLALTCISHGGHGFEFVPPEKDKRLPVTPAEGAG